MTTFISQKMCAKIITKYIVIRRLQFCVCKGIRVIWPFRIILKNKFNFIILYILHVIFINCILGNKFKSVFYFADNVLRREYEYCASILSHHKLSLLLKVDVRAVTICELSLDVEHHPTSSWYIKFVRAWQNSRQHYHAILLIKHKFEIMDSNKYLSR